MDPTQIPPEIMALLAELSPGYIAEGQNPLLAAQYETANQMRKTQMPITNDAGRGGIVAANPMQQAAAAIQQYRGGQQQRDSMDQMMSNVGKMGASQKAAVMAELLRRYQQSAAPQAQPPAPGQMMGGDPSGATPGP